MSTTDNDVTDGVPAQPVELDMDVNKCSPAEATEIQQAYAAVETTANAVACKERERQDEMRRVRAEYTPQLAALRKQHAEAARALAKALARESRATARAIVRANVS